MDPGQAEKLVIVHAKSPPSKAMVLCWKLYRSWLIQRGEKVWIQSAPMEWVPGKPVTTPFVSVPGLITSECARNENGTYLSITVHGDPKDPRTDDIRGDVAIGGQVVPQWGLHLIDMNLFMGNFQDIVRSETRAYFKKH